MLTRKENVQHGKIKKIFYLTNSSSFRGWIYNLTDETWLRPIDRHPVDKITMFCKYEFEQGKMYLLKYRDEGNENKLFLVFRVTRRRRIDVAYFEQERRTGKFVFCFPKDEGPAVLVYPGKLEQCFEKYCSTLQQNSKVTAIAFAKYLFSSGFLSKYLKAAKPDYYSFF